MTELDKVNICLDQSTSTDNPNIDTDEYIENTENIEDIENIEALSTIVSHGSEENYEYITDKQEQMDKYEGLMIINDMMDDAKVVSDLIQITKNCIIMNEQLEERIIKIEQENIKTNEKINKLDKKMEEILMTIRELGWSNKIKRGMDFLCDKIATIVEEFKEEDEEEYEDENEEIEY
jgi:hypothetical protein